jgi:hypothetical protein
VSNPEDWLDDTIVEQEDLVIIKEMMDTGAYELLDDEADEDYERYSSEDYLAIFD